MNKKLISFLLVLSLLFVSVNTLAVDKKRIQGSDRIETAVMISRETFLTATDVIIANGKNYIDALSATSLANYIKAPILLVDETLPNRTREEILRLGAVNAIVVGGKNTVTAKAENEIKKLGLNTFRIAGLDRYATSVLINEYYLTKKNADKLFVASNVADAVSSSGYRNSEIPLVIVNEKSDFDKIKTLADDIVVLGGVNSVSEDIYNKLEAKDRISGSDRFETARIIAEMNLKENEISKVLLVNGYEFVDAFTAGVLAGQNGFNILLTPGDYIEENTRTFIKEHKSEIVIVGGENSVNEDALERDKPKQKPKPEPEKPKVDSGKPMVALTFDDGPRRGSTEKILDILKANGARATFFILGNQVLGKEDILKRQVAEGHQLGNHSYNHPDLTKVSYQTMIDEVNKTQNVVFNATGIYPTVVRPPYGAINETVRTLPYPLIYWSIDTRDWESRNAVAVNNVLFSKLHDGAIILMHDIHASTAEAVETIVPRLKAMGYQMVTLQEMYDAKGKTLTPGVVHYNAK